MAALTGTPSDFLLWNSMARNTAPAMVRKILSISGCTPTASAMPAMTTPIGSSMGPKYPQPV